MSDRFDDIAREICETHFGQEWETTEADIFYAIGHARREWYAEGQREMRARCVKAAYGYSHVRPWNDKQVWAANELKALPITGEEASDE